VISGPVLFTDKEYLRVLFFFVRKVLQPRVGGSEKAFKQVIFPVPAAGTKMKNGHDGGTEVRMSRYGAYRYGAEKRG